MEILIQSIQTYSSSTIKEIINNPIFKNFTQKELISCLKIYRDAGYNSWVANDINYLITELKKKKQIEKDNYYNNLIQSKCSVIQQRKTLTEDVLDVMKEYDVMSELQTITKKNDITKQFVKSIGNMQISEINEIEIKNIQNENQKILISNLMKLIKNKAQDNKQEEYINHNVQQEQIRSQKDVLDFGIKRNKKLLKFILDQYSEKYSNQLEIQKLYLQNQQECISQIKSKFSEKNQDIEQQMIQAEKQIEKK